MSNERSVSGSDTEAPPQLSQVRETAPPGVFPVVAIGAGDAQAVQQFFAALPPGEELGFLVVPAAVLPCSAEDLAASLRAVVSLPVCIAGESPGQPARLAPNQIVVVPPTHAWKRSPPRLPSP